MKIVAPTPDGVAQAAALVRAGEIVAYPTETVYGLAADPFSVTAVEKLFSVKGRADTNPVLLIAADLEQVERVVSAISTQARKLIEQFWPGPLSLVLPKADDVPLALCGGGANVCVRVPACETARALCRAVGHAITSTSANASGAPAARGPHAIDLEGVALCIDGGTLAPSLPSTVFDPDTGVVYREGAVPAPQLHARRSQ